MTTSGIPSARKKLKHATEHIAALRTSVEAYRTTFPVQFNVQSVGNQAGMSDIFVSVTVKHAEPIPDEWALTTGDVLTNLRAALDHAIYPHVKSRKPGLDDRQIQFPIMDDETKFDAAKFVDDAHFAGPVLAEIRSSQPFQHQQQPTGIAWHPLAVLRELVNFDKHRELLIVESLPENWTLQPDPRVRAVDLTVHQDVPMTTGAMICEARLQPSAGTVLTEEIPLPSVLDYVEKIDIPKTGGKGHLLASLERLSDDVHSQLDALDQAGC